MARYEACIDVHLILRRGEEILLGKRQNTGFADGCWHCPSGHVEDGESASAALVRESAEEIGIEIHPDKARFVLLMHHYTDSGRIGLFFEATNWSGNVINQEPDKCDGWEWFALSNLPRNMIPYAADALSRYAKGDAYVERGWRMETEGFSHSLSKREQSSDTGNESGTGNGRHHLTP